MKGLRSMQVSEYIVELSKYRINKAEENIEASKILLQSEYYAESLNRSYYAIFHGLRGLLVYDEFDSKKHSGIISYFNQHYVKVGKFEKEYSMILNEAFMIRNKSDYDDFFIASKEDAKDQIEKAEVFIKAIKDYIALNFI